MLRAILDFLLSLTLTFYLSVGPKQIYLHIYPESDHFSLPLSLPLSLPWVIEVGF